MTGCCNSRGCDWFFSPRFAHRVTQRYRKRGLDKTSRQIVEFLERGGVQGATVLEIGGGVGGYPDYERLLGAAADHAGRVLVFSHPPGNPLWRSIAAAQNLAFRLLRQEFRSFAHPPEAMLAILERHGLCRTFTRRGLPFRVAGLERVQLTMAWK
jgi:magnesium-protoporphyrin O-methyltransferase